MLRHLTLLLLLVGSIQIAQTQPFDTLLLQYESLHNIFPLDDGTFILIGGGEKIIVERINSKAEPLWTVRFEKEDQVMYDSELHLNETDSSIQIRTIPSYCDLYEVGPSTVYTLSLHGEVTDSLYISNSDNPTYTALLSGRSDSPRLAYFKEDRVILGFAGGDTMELSLRYPNEDSSSFYFNTGRPKLVAMFPYGDILVGTTNSIMIWYKLENSRYVIYDRSLSAEVFNAIDMYCLADSTHVIATKRGVRKYKRNYPYDSFFPAGMMYSELKWQGADFLLKSITYTDEDSIFLLDQNLKLLYKEPIIYSDQYISSYAIKDTITYGVGSAYAWLEGGFLSSWNHNTGVGPKYYDVTLLDYNFSNYDSFKYQPSCGGYKYIFHFPEVKYTIRNNGDFPLSHATIFFSKICFCPVEGSWLRVIDHMDLAPGETKTYSLYDVIIESDNSFYDPLSICFHILRPDNHADDNTPWKDNTLCKESEIESGDPLNSEERIRSYPNPTNEILNILTSEDGSYNFQLFDSTGGFLRSQDQVEPGPAKIDLSNFASGLYYLKFFFTDGYQETVKVIKL